jgi:hypothetical protein
MKSTATSVPPVTPPVTGGSCTTPPVTISHTTSGQSPNASQLVFLNTAIYPQAVCNDGTPGGYVLRAGQGSGVNRWVISLQGGGDCYDGPSCSSRAAGSPKLVSTAPYASNPSQAPGLDGLLSSTPTTNPDFYDANEVQIIYCSSDDWSGAKTGTGTFNGNDDTTWNFQGRAILDAAIADLKANHGLNNATEVMLTGQSAGGLGVYVNTNNVAKLLASTARFVSYSDAAFLNEVNVFNPAVASPYDDPSQPSAEESMKGAGIVLWNGTGDPVCNASATTSLAQLECYNSQQLLGAGGTIQLPMLVSEAQQDQAQLVSNGIPAYSGNLTSQEQTYLQYFAGQMRTGLATTNSNVSIFSPDVLAHVEATDPTLFVQPQTFPSGQLTLQQVVSAWYKTPCSAQREIAN